MSRIWSCGGTGNSVADYTEEKHDCEHCDGTGLVEASLDDVKEAIAYARININTRKTIDEQVEAYLNPKPFWRDLLKIYREWKDNGKKLMCKDCDGAGAWITRY